MKVAILQTPLIASTGGERQSLRLAIELQKLGHEVEIFTNALDKESCYPNLLKKVTINVVPYPPNRFRPLYRLFRKYPEIFSVYTSVYPSMLNLGRKIPKGFDIINNHNFPTEWAAFFAKKRLKIPVVWMCNEPPFWFWHTEQKGLGGLTTKGIEGLNWPLCEVFDKIAVKHIDEILALSHFAAGMIKKIYNRLPKIIRSGVDVDFFHKASGWAIRKTHSLENNFVLLQVGTLFPLDYYKRQIDSLKALSYLSEKYDNVKLVLEGVGSPKMLKIISKKLGVEGKVVFLFAGTDDKELARVYASCDVFIFPPELTWGLAVTEAMAAGKAVVVSNKAGASEIIENNVNGIVVNHAKPKEIAGQVERLMNDPKLRKKLGENAYEYVKENLSWEKYAENIESVFQQTISNFGRCL